MACLVLAKCIWPKSKNHQTWFLAECIQPATSFPLSDSVAFFHWWPGSCSTKPGQIWFGSGWLCQVLAKQVRLRSKLVCTNYPAHFWPMLPSQSGSDVNRSSMFTGLSPNNATHHYPHLTKSTATNQAPKSINFVYKDKNKKPKLHFAC